MIYAAFIVATASFWIKNCPAESSLKRRERHDRTHYNKETTLTLSCHVASASLASVRRGGSIRFELTFPVLHLFMCAIELRLPPA